MLEPTWPGWAPTWRTETNKIICYRDLIQKPEFIYRELINVNVTLFLMHELLRDNSLGRHVNATSRKSLEIQAYSITKTRTLLKPKCV